MNYYNDNPFVILKDNIITLTKIHEKTYNDKLLNEISELKFEKDRLKRKLEDRDKELREKEQREDKRLRTSKYSFRIFKKTRDSYTDQQINDTFYNLKSITDIIKLKDKWIYIRHNCKLQKLYNLIEPLEKLDNLVGLKSIKEDIFKTIIYYIQNFHRDEYLHTVIYGPPGVGKTEFAKIYSDIFIRLNILKQDKFIQIKRSDLVAEYLGQTAIKTKNLLENAKGGVVFLDEAYSLGNPEKRDSFSKEAIDTINEFLSEHKNEFMFVIAGYQDDIESCFFGYNKGLKRRFANYFTIDKYSDLELLDIFKIKVNYYNYKLEVDENKLKEFFKINYKNFVNYAGDIEKLINNIKYEQSLRCFNKNIVSRIIIFDDIKKSYDKMIPIQKDDYLLSMYI